MRRRTFIGGVGSAAAWQLAALAQQGERVRRIGVFMNLSADDPGAKLLLSGFTQGLSELGWTDGRNLRVDIRWAAGNVDVMPMFAKELVDLQPDVLISHTTPETAALQRQTQTIPIVFVNVPDPVGPGFVTSLARPAGNLTGFILVEAAMSGKLLELLTEIAPGVKRAAVIFNPTTAASGAGRISCRHSRQRPARSK
jgi:putative ABC transport system substrate-binding protein